MFDEMQQKQVLGRWLGPKKYALAYMQRQIIQSTLE